MRGECDAKRPHQDMRRQPPRGAWAQSPQKKLNAASNVRSSDGLYASDGAQAAKALKAAGASRLYLAGRPGDLEQALSDAGVDDFVFAGMDVLDGLGEVLTHLGAA